MTEHFGFAAALRLMQTGKTVACRRDSWPKDSFIGIVWPPHGSVIGDQPWLMMHHASTTIPWVPEQEDLFATDWSMFHVE